MRSRDIARTFRGPAKLLEPLLALVFSILLILGNRGRVVRECDVGHRFVMQDGSGCVVALLPQPVADRRRQVTREALRSLAIVGELY